MKLWQFASFCGAFAFGVGLRSLFELSLNEVVWLLLVSFGLGVWWRRNRSAISAPVVFTLSFTFLFCALGIFRTELHSWQFVTSPLQSQVGSEVSFTGTVIREPDRRERTQHLYVQIEKEIVLVTADRLLDVSYGDYLAVSGTLRQPEAFTTDFGRTFDYPGYLRARGVAHTMSFAEVTVLEKNNGNGILSALLSLKHQIMRSIEQFIPEPYAGLGEGLLLGVKQALGDQLEEDFRKTGIIHIVVLSGYNVMLVVAFVMFGLSFFLRQHWRLAAGLLAIICFALIVGLSATVVRASIMASLLLIATTFGRNYDVLRALLFAGVFMILINPYLLLYDIGFQLSFMATLGLILAVPHFESTIATATTRISIKEYVFATTATQIAVLPLLLYHIGEVSLVSIAVNVLVLPAVPIAMLLTFLTSLAGFVFTPLTSLIAYGAYLVLAYIIIIAEWFATLPFSAISVPAFSPRWILVYYVALWFVWRHFTKRNHDQDTFRDWQIEEEPIIKSSGAGQSVPDDLPVFFR